MWECDKLTIPEMSAKRQIAETVNVIKLGNIR